MVDKNTNGEMLGGLETAITEKKPKLNRNWLLAGGGLVLLVGGIGLGLFLGKQKAGRNEINQQNEKVAEISPNPDVKEDKPVLIEGKLRLLNEDLKLFLETEDDKLNGTSGNESYYEAGKYKGGEYDGYTRIIALKPNWGPGDPLVYKLASLDFKNYFLDDPEGYSRLPNEDWRNPFKVLDKSKISKAVMLPDKPGKVIEIDDTYSLYEEEYPLEFVDTNRKDFNGNLISKVKIIDNFSDYKILKTAVEGLEMRLAPNPNKNTDFSQYPEKEKTKQQTLLGLFPFKSRVVVIDSSGLPKIYSMSLKGNVDNYLKLKKDYENKILEYNRQLLKYEAKEISEMPNYPEFVSLPGMGFYSSQLKNIKTDNFFKLYSAAFPDACSNSSASRVANIKDEELVEVGKINNLPVFKLKDDNHQLYRLAFDNKMDYYEQDLNGWDEVNKGRKKPSFEEYKQQNPLLFVKDYWKEWIILGEYDILMPGGCGKPVIYLYPEKEMKVRVGLLNQTRFTADIPRYSNGWEVLASPDGSLRDLRPEMTDCGKIGTNKEGAEYAQKACNSGVYPYLYWSGQVEGLDYPASDEGFVVDRKELGSFFDSKLKRMGLIKQEIEDFKKYWVKEIEKSNKPYYRIGFLQTEELNRLFPMAVEPKPETVIRIFMDYQPLDEKPKNTGKGPELRKIERIGFSLVEWGGKKIGL